MKTIIFLVALAFGAICHGQTAIATATANGTTVTATVGNNSQQTKTTTTSVSVQISDDSYLLIAKFDSFRRKDVQKLLLENLEKEYLIQNGTTMIWRRSNNGDAAYSVTLSDEKLKITVDKELVSGGTVEKFKALGEKISESLRK